MTTLQEKVIGDPIEEKKLSRSCLYCGATVDLEMVSGDGGYGQPRAYACREISDCLIRQSEQLQAAKDRRRA